MKREPIARGAPGGDRPAARFHVALSRRFDLEAMERGADQDRNPRHILYRVQQRLCAALHLPEPEAARWIDRVLSLLIAQPAQWALARRLSRELDRGDVVYCAGDDIGMALAIACAVRGRRPTLAVWVMAPSKKRFRAVMTALGLKRRVEFLLVNTPQKVAQLRRYLHVPDRRVLFLGDQTDVRFFSPGPRRQPSARPVIFSAGLERRDYRTLALATRELDLDVRLAAVSPNASPSQSAFPETLPANMSIGDYPWLQYRQALRDADAIVLPLLKSDYSPGLTVLIEAMACRRPVIVTRTPGMIEKLIEDGVVQGVEVGDVAGLRAAIVGVLGDRESAEARAERGYRLVLEQFNSDHVVDQLVTWLGFVAAGAA